MTIPGFPGFQGLVDTLAVAKGVAEHFFTILTTAY